MISVTPWRVLDALAATFLLGSIACGGHAPDAQAPLSVAPDTLPIAPPSPPAVAVAAAPVAQPPPTPPTDTETAPQPWDDMLQRAAAASPSERGALMVGVVDRCTDAVNAHYFDPCLHFATAFSGDAAHALAAGDAALRHGHRGLALKLFRAAAQIDPRALCRHDAALALVAEVRSGDDDPALVTDGNAIHASCATFTKRP
jgi:hypothetical protein